MGRRFGVEIQIGEWVDLTPVGYEISPTADYRTLEDGLDKFGRSYGKISGGLFPPAVLWGICRGMKIALTGGLVSGADSGYPTKADGYVTQAGKLPGNGSQPGGRILSSLCFFITKQPI